jgi:hypothetical protein
MDSITLDYLVLVFLGSCGVLQIAAAHARIHGLLFLPRPAQATALGVVLVVAGLVWFFGPGPRHVPDTAGGLDGNDQGAYFALAAGAAVTFTLLASSVLNRRRLTGARSGGSGLDALRDTTYLGAMSAGVKVAWQQRRRWTRWWSSG